MILRECSSVGLEHYLDRVGVGGSNPSTLTKACLDVKSWTSFFYTSPSLLRLLKVSVSSSLTSSNGVLDSLRTFVQLHFNPLFLCKQELKLISNYVIFLGIFIKTIVPIPLLDLIIISTPAI